MKRFATQGENLQYTMRDSIPGFRVCRIRCKVIVLRANHAENAEDGG